MLTRVHHVGLVVRRLEDGLAFWQDTLGLRIAKQATVQDQGVRAALLPIGRSDGPVLVMVSARQVPVLSTSHQRSPSPSPRRTPESAMKRSSFSPTAL